MIKFGTGGWRAIIGDEFTKANIQLLSKAMCIRMKQEGNDRQGILIGYDRRFLSKEAMRWCGEVFAQEGITAMLVNKAAPTPLIMYYVQKHELPYGMMITASHNPSLYNGIKIFTAGGRDASREVTDELEQILAGIDPEQVHGMEYEKAIEEGLIQEVYPLNEYIDSILEKIDCEAIKAKQMKVALDPMYGVSGIPLKTLLYTTRCDIDPRQP